MFALKVETEFRLSQWGSWSSVFCFGEEFWGGVVMTWMRLQFWETMSWEEKGEYRTLSVWSQLDFISVVPPQYDVKIAHMKKMEYGFS